MKNITFRELFSIQGRFNREPYWIIGTISGGIAAIVDKATDLKEVQTFLDSQPLIGVSVGILSLVTVIIAVIIGTTSSIKRLHDLDKTGWFVLLNFVPFVNLGMLIWLGFIKGTSGKNRYGEDSLNNSFKQEITQ